MGTKIDYKSFLEDLDKKLDSYFKSQAKFLYCKKGCSSCCEKGDYPLSDIELQYLMFGYAKLANTEKIQIQENIKSMKKGEACPFLINKICSVYDYRPIICRVHGLAYLTDNTVRVPYCANENKNYAKVYKNNVFFNEPIKEDLSTYNLIKDLKPGEIKYLYDWLK